PAVPWSSSSLLQAAAVGAAGVFRASLAAGAGSGTGVTASASGTAGSCCKVADTASGRRGAAELGLRVVGGSLGEATGLGRAAATTGLDGRGRWLGGGVLAER